MPIKLPPGMGIEDIRSVPPGEMPPSTVPPSIEELFRQGNVQVTPGATGPESMRQDIGGAFVPPSPEESRLRREPGLEELLLAPQTSPDVRLGVMEALKGLRGERAQEQQLTSESERQRASIAAQKEMAQTEAQAAMQRTVTQESMRQTGDIARLHEEARLRQDLMMDTFISDGPLKGRTPRMILSMRPEQREALLGSLVGSQNLRDFGTFMQGIQMLAMFPQLAEYMDQLLLLGVSVFNPSLDMKKFVQYTIDPKTGKPTIKFNIAEAMGLVPTTAGPRIEPQAPSPETPDLSGIPTPAP